MHSESEVASLLAVAGDDKRNDSEDKEHFSVKAEIFCFHVHAIFLFSFIFLHLFNFFCPLQQFKNWRRS